MDQDLQIRGYSPRTRRVYLGCVRNFVKFFGTPPDKLGTEDIRRYQLHLIDRQVSWTTFNQSVCALRFFFNVTLGKNWDVRHLPYHKRGRRLPEILAAQEVTALIDAAANLRDKAVLMALYGGGLRLNEVRVLKAGDIDSGRMLLRVIQGKGRKDRYVKLPETFLLTLRAYWLEARPPVYLFPGTNPMGPLSERAIQRMVKETALRAGITKRVTPHGLRHAYATHHLENGTNLREIQALLGHRSLNTTSLYTHVANTHLAPSPLDRLPGFVKEVPPIKE
jgi:site-specific recombinase XerD